MEPAASATDLPRLRPVEVRPAPDGDPAMVVVTDPSALAGVALTVSVPALQLLALMDGQHSRAQICDEFAGRFGQAVAPEMLDDVIGRLDEAHFLEGPAFEAHYAGMVQSYRDAPARIMNDVAGLGLDAADVAGGLDEMFPWPSADGARGALRGLIAPHLDYRRGRGCYLQAYARLRDQTPRRFVILGTNHFGRSRSVVATDKDFRTPLGTTAVDRDLLGVLEARLGTALRQHELDHAREHSVELQVLILQHLFGADQIRIVPFLCPDPCGPTGTAPVDGAGVDLGDFARALGDEVAADTCIIAAADLSHIGAFFGDERTLTDDYLEEVRGRDALALATIEANDAPAFRAQVARDDNPTRICSAGCIFTLMTALPQARARRLGYNQAVDREAQCSVSCAAVAFEA